MASLREIVNVARVTVNSWLSRHCTSIIAVLITSIIFIMIIINKDSQHYENKKYLSNILQEKNQLVQEKNQLVQEKNQLVIEMDKFINFQEYLTRRQQQRVETLEGNLQEASMIINNLIRQLQNKRPVNPDNST